MFRTGLTDHRRRNHSDYYEKKNSKNSNGKKMSNPLMIVKCQYCGIDYSNKSIKKHMGDKHPEKFYTDENKKLEVKCSQCDEIFGSYNSKYCLLKFLYTVWTTKSVQV